MKNLISVFKKAGYALPALLALVASVPAQALPQEFSAVYSATARGMTVGRAEFRLQRSGDNYQYSSAMGATGVVGLFFRDEIYETSAGTLTARGIRPEQYDYRRTGSDGRKDNIRFASSGGEAVLHYKGKTREAALPAEALDPLSLHIALMNDVDQGRQSMRYLIAEPRRLRAYELKMAGRERIRTPRGELDTIRVDLVGKADADVDFALAEAEIPRLGKDQQTSFWFAPELDNLLVRIRHSDPDDGEAVIELEKIESLQPGATDAPAIATSSS